MSPGRPNKRIATRPPITAVVTVRRVRDAELHRKQLDALDRLLDPEPTPEDGSARG